MGPSLDLRGTTKFQLHRLHLQAPATQQNNNNSKNSHHHQSQPKNINKINNINKIKQNKFSQTQIHNSHRLDSILIDLTRSTLVQNHKNHTIHHHSHPTHPLRPLRPQIHFTHNTTHRSSQRRINIPHIIKIQTPRSHPIPALHSLPTPSLECRSHSRN